jgi:hypothetical protein
MTSVFFPCRHIIFKNVNLADLLFLKIPDSFGQSVYAYDLFAWPKVGRRIHTVRQVFQGGHTIPGILSRS